MTLTIEVLPDGPTNIRTLRLGLISIGAHVSAVTGQWHAYAYAGGADIAEGRGPMPDDAVRACLDALERLRDDVTAALEMAGRVAEAA